MHYKDELEQAYHDTLKAKNRLDGMLGTCLNERLRTVAEEQALLGLINHLRDKQAKLQKMGVSRTSSLLPSSKPSQILTRRVEKLVDDCQILILAAERELKIFARQIQADRERETLLSRGGDKGGDSNRRRLGSSNALDEATLGDERERLDQTSTMIIGAIEQGRLSLYNLINQKHLLQGSRKKLQTAFMTAGVSASTLTSIEARLRSDRFIVYVGIAVVSLLIYLFFCWWTGIHIFWWFPSRLIRIIIRILESIWRLITFLPRIILSNRRSNTPSVATTR